MIIKYQVQSDFVTVLHKLTQSCQELHHVVLPCRWSLHEEGLVHIHTYSTIKSYIYSSVLVDQQFHRFIRMLPGFSITQPHIERRLVKVNHNLVLVDQLGQLDAEVQND